MRDIYIYLTHLYIYICISHISHILCVIYIYIIYEIYIYIYIYITHTHTHIYIYRLPWWLRKESACNAGDLSSFCGLGRSSGEGNSLGAWQASVHFIYIYICFTVHGQIDKDKHYMILLTCGI